tara:strand:+ start:1443 stop:2171 length:729 start_codon:yes stop_codon:yes gene_type:complete
MARISTYGVDAKPELGDKVIGTDTNPGANLRTKNYSLQEVVDLFNHGNSLAVADQSIFLFQSDISEGRETGTLSFAAGGGVGTAFSAITSILLSKTASGNKNVAQYLQLFLNKGIILAEVGNINNFGQYTVNSIVDYPADNSFYEVTLSLTSSNGVLAVDGYYIFGEFTNSSGGGGDKNYVFPHNQSVAAVTWNVQHNLNKFPSCTMVLSTGQQGYGDVTFIDVNNLTITFASAETGKAYIN